MKELHRRFLFFKLNLNGRASWKVGDNFIISPASLFIILRRRDNRVLKSNNASQWIVPLMIRLDATKRIKINTIIQPVTKEGQARMSVKTRKSVRGYRN